MAKHILLACELGTGIRSLDRLLPIGRGLAAANHRVSVALRDPAIAHALPDCAGWSTTVAPTWRVPPPPGFVAVSFADVLLQCGYATPEALRGLISAWRRSFETLQPDLLIADFAPTAVLAARLTGLDAIVVGNGYTLPPAEEPLPSMRPWEDNLARQVRESDARALAVIGPTLLGMGGAPLTRLADMFGDADSRFLCTFAELDHYASRGEADYFGEVFDESAGAAPIFPPGAGGRVFVRIDGRHPALGALIAALHRLGLPSIVEATHMSDGLAQAASRTHVRVVANQLHGAAALAACDIVACQDIATAAPALLAGRPLLMLPWPVEQTMTLHRVASQGLGHGIPPTATAEDAEAALRRLLDDAPCRMRAANFARSYSGYAPSIATDAIIEACLER